MSKLREKKWNFFFQKNFLVATSRLWRGSVVPIISSAIVMILIKVIHNTGIFYLSISLAVIKFSLCYNRKMYFLSLRVFGLLSSSLLSFPQRFGQYILWPFPDVCSNLGTFTELWTMSFIESMGVASSDSISHNRVQVLSIPAVTRLQSGLNLQPPDDCLL